MRHSFNKKIAKEAGIASAVVFQSILDKVNENMASNTRFQDGKYWMSCSVSDFAKFFGYLTEKQVRTAIDRLVEKGFIESASYNKSNFDNTKWYSPTKKGLSYVSIRPDSLG